jgi:hypothetical protein
MLIEHPSAIYTGLAGHHSMMPPDQPPFSQPRVARRVMDIYCQIKPSATVSLGE